MTKRILFTILCAVTCTNVLVARVPTQTEVTEVAQYIVARDSFQGIMPDRTVESISRVELENGYGVWVVALTPGGHLVLGTSTKYRAMISWGEESFVIPDRASPQYALLLRAAQRAAAAEAGDGEDHPSWTIDASEFLATSIPTSAIIHQPVDTAKWSQKGVMAWYVPGSAPCGCVATALAQMMHALQWPVYAETTFDADLLYNNENAEAYNFHPYTRFDYGMMDLSLTDSTTKLSKNQQVARLVLLCDILARMNFVDGGSGAVGSWAAVTPWVMEPKILEITTDTETDETYYLDTQIATVKQTMADGVPIMAAIPDHAILASGYALYGSEPYVRLNYGWGGSGSGWYPIDDTEELTIAYPKRTVQCDPLPAISSATPTLSWHLPKCYTDKVKGFKITATTIPTATSGSTTWTDSFESLSGDTAGNTESILVGNLTNSSGWWRNYQLQVYLHDVTHAFPKALYTWQPTFIPTANSTWTFSYNYRYARGPIYLQILPLGGTWETVWVNDPGEESDNTSWKSASVTLSKYAGVPCQLRLFAHPTVYSNSFYYGLPLFSMKNMSVTHLAQVITSPTKTVTVSDASARSYTFSSGALEAGEKYAFTVTPLFTDSNVSGTPSMPCYTQLADDDHPEESFASLTFTSPSTQALSQTKMQMQQNLFRYCSYTSKSIIRLKTEESIESLELYPSHPDAYPLSAFSVESYGEGYFDICIDGTQIPTSPRVNDRLNLTVVAVSKAGTKTAHDLTLVFTLSTSHATGETASAPILSKITYTDPQGTVYSIPREWFDSYGLADKASTATYTTLAGIDSDGDSLTNAAEYLIGSNPADDKSKLIITGITVNSDKTVTVTYSPTGNGSVSTFILEGKKNLSDAVWESHGATDTTHRFFRVRVEPK